MADNIFLKADEMGKELRDKREAEKAQKAKSEGATEEADKAAAQKEEDKEQGMI